MRTDKEEKISPALIIIIDVVFAIWGGVGQEWYIYPLNFVLLFIASSIINTNYLQALTRSYAALHLYGFNGKGISSSLGVSILALIFILVGFVITCFVFTTMIQFILFFVACIVLSTIVAFVDDMFSIALSRTLQIESKMK